MAMYNKVVNFLCGAGVFKRTVDRFTVCFIYLDTQVVYGSSYFGP